MLGGLTQRCHRRERLGEDGDQAGQAPEPVARPRRRDERLLVRLPGGQRGCLPVGQRYRRLWVDGQLRAGQPGSHPDQIVPVGVQPRLCCGEPAVLPAGGSGGGRVREARGAGVTVGRG